MTILLVSARNDVADYLRTEPVCASSLVHYNHPLKALDNIEELRPIAVIWGYDDFPRHWKTLKGLIDASGMKTCFILVAEQALTETEAAKLQPSGIDACITDGFFDEKLLNELHRLLPDQLMQTVSHYEPKHKIPKNYKLAIYQPGRGLYLFEEFTCIDDTLQGTLVTFNYIELPKNGTRAVAILYEDLLATIRLPVLISEVSMDGQLTMNLLEKNEAYIKITSVDKTHVVA